MDKDSDKRHSIVANLMPSDWDQKPFTFMTELRQLLHTLKDEGTSIDSGCGPDYGDLWVTVGGVEFFVSARRSNKQLKSEGRLPPEASCGPLDRQ